MKGTIFKKNGNNQKISSFSLKLLLQFSSLLVPSLASRIVLKMFLTPVRLNEMSNKERAVDSKSKLTIYPFADKQIYAYSWGEGDQTILLIHGWSGRASHMGAFIKPLVNAGYRVVAFDGPAHGRSSGSQTDMVEFAASIGYMIEELGSVYAIVAHSFGAGCTLLANKELKLKVEKLVLIGCFSDAVYITESFGKLFHIKPSIMERMRKILEDKHGNKWRWKDIAPSYLIKTASIPTLLIHDENDEEVPYQQALELKEAGINCSLFTTKRLGHRLILRHPSVIKKGVSFCEKYAIKEI